MSSFGTVHLLEIRVFFLLIKCLNNGKLENFGNPYDLLIQRNNILFELVQNLDKIETEKLVEIARISKLHQNKRKASLKKNKLT